MNDKTNYPSQSQDKYVLRLPDGMRDKIAALAKASGRTMNAEIVQRLQRSIEGVPASPAAPDLGAASARVLKSVSDSVAALARQVELQREMFEKLDLGRPSQQLLQRAALEVRKKVEEQQKMVNAVADAASRPTRGVAEKLRRSQKMPGGS